MQHTNLKNYVIILSVLIGFCAFNQSIALESDQNQPINVVSNEQTADLNNNTANFIGNVEATQGSIKILADKVTITRNKDGTLKDIIAYGKPVRFSQKLDNGKIIKSRSSTLTYNTAKNILVLAGKAVINQGESQLSSDKIEYNLTTKQMRANTTQTQGRVSSTFIPSEVKNDK